jgi:hypothetical protein
MMCRLIWIYWDPHGIKAWRNLSTEASFRNSLDTQMTGKGNSKYSCSLQNKYPKITFYIMQTANTSIIIAKCSCEADIVLSVTWSQNLSIIVTLNRWKDAKEMNLTKLKEHKMHRDTCLMREIFSSSGNPVPFIVQ